MRARGRALLVAVAAAAACSGPAGCTALPGFEDELDAILLNESGVEVTTYRADGPTGDRHRDLTTEAGGSATLPLGGNCESGWWVQRMGDHPVQLGVLCPGDEVTVTADDILR